LKHSSAKCFGMDFETEAGFGIRFLTKYLEQAGGCMQSLYVEATNNQPTNTTYVHPSFFPI
jgi:hypothetical protein